MIDDKKSKALRAECVKILSSGESLMKCRVERFVDLLDTIDQLRQQVAQLTAAIVNEPRTEAGNSRPSVAVKDTTPCLHSHVRINDDLTVTCAKCGVSRGEVSFTNRALHGVIVVAPRGGGTVSE